MGFGGDCNCGQRVRLCWMALSCAIATLSPPFCLIPAQNWIDRSLSAAADATEPCSWLG